MTSALDPAIAKALSIDPSATSIKSHGGSGFSSTFKITTTVEGKEKSFFMKTAKGREAGLMFAGEHASLNALSDTVPSISPRSYGHGELTSSPDIFFLVTSFIDLSPSSSAKSSSTPLAHKLALLHSTPAPIPPDHTTPQFGFPVPTSCGDSIQDNTYSSSWAEFYAQRRLGGVLQLIQEKQGVDKELRGLVKKVMGRVVERLIGDGQVKQGKGKGENVREGEDVVPVLVHGDLWSGNHGRGILQDLHGEEEGKVQEIVFDPSCCWGHGEYEWGIMKMFGGFGGDFERRYREIKGKDHPVEEWADRVELYELYHHLNHYAIFGGGYRGGAVRIMEGLIAKYGDPGDGV